MPEHDCLRRFLFEQHGIRGVWVKLTDSWQAAKQHQQQPEIAVHQLGQALACVSMLSTTVKFDGAMIMQAQSNGAITTLVAQATNQRKIRGVVKCHSPMVGDSLTELFGEGRLVLTIEAGNGKPYQGIVPLQGENLAAALQMYFEQSEQLKTRLWLFADDNHAAGLLLQELPSQEGQPNDWETIEILASTVTAKEMFELDCHELLHRLFNEEDIRLFDAEDVAFECACSRERIEKTLNAMGEEELRAILNEQEIIEVTCEFCGETYRFYDADVEKLLTLN
ncbi:MAG: Hsp33 family molecular chaperone HslO [Methylococcales bacterium]|nr:Hsp33 family molecular chaperone HslO [Methylococcales bacterium]